jgi:hypothetical protein
VLAAARTDANVTADLSVTASFAINTYTLSYTAGANGTITGTTPQTVDHGADGTPVTATPNTGYHFVSWSDGVLTAARTDANVTADLSVTASFAVNSAFALSFGGDTYVTFGDPAALDLAQFTLECWFRRDGAGSTTSTGSGGVTDAIPLVTHGASQADGSNVDMNFFLGIKSSTSVLCADFEEGAGGSSPGLNHPILGTTPLVTGTWYHAAATYDGTTWRLYLNGNPEAQLTVGQPVQSGSIQHAALASSITSTGTAQGYFNGVLDEVRIWSTVRTPTELQSSANSQIATPQAGLAARWSLDEGTGTAVNGSAGTAVNGAVTGTSYAWVGPAPFNLSFTPPADPTALTAVAASFTQIDLAWTDNANNETGFEINGPRLVPRVRTRCSRRSREHDHTDMGLSATTEYYTGSAR